LASESYKKWSLIIIFIVVAVFVAVLVYLRTPYHAEKFMQRQQTKELPQGPLIDKDIKEVMPPELTGKESLSAKELAHAGDIYFETNRFKEAIAIYRKVLELNPQDVDTYNDLGLALHYTGNSGEAIEVLRKGTGVDPSFQRIWLSLGYVLATSGRGNEARPALEKAIELDPSTEQGQEAKKILGMLN
jgi:tetratricopeptide (TPR) repeat protein